MKKKDEEKRKEEEHQKLVSRTIASAEGGADMTRKIQAKGRMDAKNSWWVGELVADCKEHGST